LIQHLRLCLIHPEGDVRKALPRACLRPWIDETVCTIAADDFKHIASLVRARIVIKRKRGRERVCTLRPEAIRRVSDWAISYRQFWEERFDKLDLVVIQMKKEEIRDDRKYGQRH
jgi:hypothetical protein